MNFYPMEVSYGKIPERGKKNNFHDKNRDARTTHFQVDWLPSMDKVMDSKWILFHRQLFTRYSDSKFGSGRAPIFGECTKFIFLFFDSKLNIEKDPIVFFSP